MLNEELFERVSKYLKNNSVFYKIFKLTDGYFLAKKYGVIHFTNTWEISKKLDPIEINQEDKIAVKFLIDYKRRLKKISQETNKYNSKTILVTQKLYKDHPLSNALNLVNNATKIFCIENHVTCLPLDEKINFDFENEFYDLLHTRPSGNERIAEFISSELKN